MKFSQHPLSSRIHIEDTPSPSPRKFPLLPRANVPTSADHQTILHISEDCLHSGPATGQRQWLCPARVHPARTSRAPKHSLCATSAEECLHYDALSITPAHVWLQSSKLCWRTILPRYRAASSPGNVFLRGQKVSRSVSTAGEPLVLGRLVVYEGKLIAFRSNRRHPARPRL